MAEREFAGYGKRGWLHTEPGNEAVRNQGDRPDRSEDMAAHGSHPSQLIWGDEDQDEQVEGCRQPADSYADRDHRGWANRQDLSKRRGFRRWFAVPDARMGHGRCGV